MDKHKSTAQTDDTKTHIDIYRQTQSYCAVRECQYELKIKQCDLLKEVIKKCI